jgi:uncharacterized protein
MKKKVSIVLSAFAGAYLLLCLSIGIWQNRLIFFPDRAIKSTPQNFNIKYEEVNIAIGKDNLYGWWMPANNNSEKVMIYLHGNSSNISGANLRAASRFWQAGFSILLVDYRGYGRSTGDFPTEASVYQDAQSMWNYLIEKRKIKAENIYIYGHSLGGAIAIDLAVENPQAAGSIVECTFTSIREMAGYQKKYNLLPLDFVVTQKFDSIGKIPKLKVPLLVVHGMEDKTVPSFMGEALYNKAKQPKKLWLVDNAGHNNIGDIAREKYFQTIRDFVEVVDDKNREAANRKL